jgi:hypothetical protein
MPLGIEASRPIGGSNIPMTAIIHTEASAGLLYGATIAKGVGLP